MRKIPVFIVFITIAGLVCFSSASCSDKKPATDTIAADTNYVDTTSVDTLESIIAETPMPKAADELFDDFIFNFAANRKLQLSRIKFPLQVNNNNKVEYVAKKAWRMEHFFMRQGYYTLIFDTEKRLDVVKDTTINHVIIERISLNKQTVKQFIFNRIDGKWMMTAVNNSSIKQNPNSSFLQFYQRFSTDSAFQVQSMNNTVEFTSPNPDDDFSSQTGIIDPEQWPSFKPALIPKNVIYNVIYGNKYSKGAQKIFIIRGIANGLEEQMVFRMKNGAWKLFKFNS